MLKSRFILVAALAILLLLGVSASSDAAPGEPTGAYAGELSWDGEGEPRQVMAIFHADGTWVLMVQDMHAYMGHRADEDDDHHIGPHHGDGDDDGGWWQHGDGHPGGDMGPLSQVFGTWKDAGAGNRIRLSGRRLAFGVDDGGYIGYQQLEGRLRVRPRSIKGTLSAPATISSHGFCEDRGESTPCVVETSATLDLRRLR